MRISDWSSDVCSSDLGKPGHRTDRLMPHLDPLAFRANQCPAVVSFAFPGVEFEQHRAIERLSHRVLDRLVLFAGDRGADILCALANKRRTLAQDRIARSEEHTSALQSLFRISYAVFCLKKKQQSTL